ncbi:hypothetical protein [Cognatishimia activa]|uniref:Lipoprotein n=1 Tax=Cognatishimia activa TaxID=1715691 RepID=A0A0P1ILW0_9RHOB|nr:hypothetical protein [Cognatishimia activa]MEE2946337.1 hypothetical protein [Pseudomonadota bacterium]CUI40276.1 hypothetical protein TA5113_00394 [Cognatishimia activa]CUK24546.1 hypothetical protein TA5114_00331 [Cognatishimia activa]
MFKRVLAAGLLFGMVATAPPAHANNCALRDKVVDRLQTKYSESLTAGGLQGSKNVQTMVEVWASEKTGTFTVILTNPQGISCVVATGTDFFKRDVPIVPDGVKS